MLSSSLFVPLYKAIDKVFFGVNDFQEIENETEHFNSENDDEFLNQESNNYQLLLKE